MIGDLQPGEVVIAEKIDRISRLPLPEAERLVASIRDKGARLALPGVIDLSELAADARGVARVVLKSVQDTLLKLALQIARDDYEDRRERRRQGVDPSKLAGKYVGRKADTTTHHRTAQRRAQHCHNRKPCPVLVNDHSDVEAIYNVAGANAGLAQALKETDLAGRIVVVAHEINSIAPPLIREGTVDFLIAQSAATLLKTALRATLNADRGGTEHRLLDFTIHTEFNVPAIDGSTLFLPWTTDRRPVLR